MKLNIIKKKAASLREIGRETVEIPKASTLKELLYSLTEIEFQKQHQTRNVDVLDAQSVQSQAELGRVSFGERYNQERGDLEKAVQVMLQDFEDGLFRVYVNQDEYTCLEEPLKLQEGDEITLIRLVMLAGRMW